MKANKPVEKYKRKLLCRPQFFSSHKMDAFGKMVHHYQDGVKSTRDREFHYKIYANNTPGSRGNGERSHQTRLMLIGMLGTLAGKARLNIVEYVFANPQPGHRPSDQIQSV